MADLGKFNFAHRSKAGEEYRFSGQITVDKSGMFRIVVSDPDLAATIAKLPAVPGYDKPKIDQGSKNWAVYASDLAVAKHYVMEGIKTFLEPQATEEYVIIYDVSSRWSAWREKGSIHFWPNGASTGAPQRPEADWDGQGKEGNTFSFGIGAAVYKKVVIQRGEHSKTDFFPVGENDPVGPAAVRLNQYACRNSGFRPRDNEIPYTEEAAAFFLSLVEAVVKIGIMTKDRLEPANILESITAHASGNLKMLEG